MRPFRWFGLRRDSLRTRLMLWNMVSLAAILLLVGGLIDTTVRQSLHHTIDRELEERQPPFVRGEHSGPGIPPNIQDALSLRAPHPAPANEGPNGGGPDAPFGGGHSPHDMGRGGGPQHGPHNSPDGSPDNGGGPHYGGPPDGFGNGPDSPGGNGPRQSVDKYSVWHRSRLYNLQEKPVESDITDPPANEAAFRRAIATGQEVITDGEVDDEPARLLYTPMKFDGHTVAVSQAAYRLTEVNLTLAGMRTAMLTLIPVALLLAGLGGAWLTDRALRPVRTITSAAEQIGADDLSRRLPVAGDDEFARLAGTFNGMLSRLEMTFAQREELVHQLQELVLQQQRFTGDASHELRTPLTIIKANTSLLLPSQPTPAEWREGIEEIDAAANAMTRLVQDLLLLTRSDGGQLGCNRETLAVHEVLQNAVQRVRKPETAPISLQFSPSSSLQTGGVPLTIRGNADELTRLFVNLLENAQRYTPADGTIRVTAEPHGEQVTIRVTDSGAGIAAEHLPYLCERFYRVDSARSRPDGGTGLGLAICKSIVEAHGGTLDFASIVGEGTAVIVTLPA